MVQIQILNFARPRRSSLSCPLDDDDEDENIGEEADEVVPEGTEEVELAKINLERKERERTLLINDIRTLSVIADISGDLISSPQHDDNLWMITGARSTLVRLICFGDTLMLLVLILHPNIY